MRWHRSAYVARNTNRKTWTNNTTANHKTYNKRTYHNRQQFLSLYHNNWSQARCKTINNNNLQRRLPRHHQNSDRTAVTDRTVR